MRESVIIVKVQKWLSNSSSSNEPNKEKRKVKSTINTASHERKDTRREITKLVGMEN